MPFIPQQAPAALDTDGLRKHGEEQFREVARAWTEIEASIASLTSNDAALAASIATKVAKAGDTMTGLLLLSADPGAALGAATKQYVDSVIAAAIAAAAVKKNYIINGATMISQENGSTAVGFGTWPVDQFFILGSAANVNGQQIASVTPAGSPNRLRITVIAADTSIAAADYAGIQQPIEGFRVADLKLGTASAKTFTLQFGVKSSVAGTFSVAFLNSATNRSYTADYVIGAGEVNTDVVKSVTVTGDLTGTWLTNNGVGIYARWALAAGSNFAQTPGSWATGPSGTAVGSTNQVNFLGTNGNTFELFDVGLYEGSILQTFKVPDYAEELQNCMRYFEKLDGNIIGTNSTGAFTGGGHWAFKVRKRAIPAMTGVVGSAGIVATGLDGSSANTTTGAQAGFNSGATANARL